MVIKLSKTQLIKALKAFKEDGYVLRIELVASNAEMLQELQRLQALVPEVEKWKQCKSSIQFIFNSIEGD